MRTFFQLAIVAIVLSVAPSLYAGSKVEYKQPPPDTSPTVTACIAYRSYGQMCKECMGTTHLDGTHTRDCKDRSYNSGCYCAKLGPDVCDWRGLCSYS